MTESFTPHNAVTGDQLTKLAVRMKTGDAGAARALYDALAHKVFGYYMSRLANRDAAEDLTQDIFLKLVEHVGSFDEFKGTFLGWFWQMVRNALTDHYRSKKEVSLEEILPEHEEKWRAGDLGEHAEARFRLEQLRAFLVTLSAEEQELFEMRYVGELSYKEIASVLSKEEGSLRVAVSRLKKKIRGAFP